MGSENLKILLIEKIGQIAVLRGMLLIALCLSLAACTSKPAPSWQHKSGSNDRNSELVDLIVLPAASEAVLAELDTQRFEFAEIYDKALAVSEKEGLLNLKRDSADFSTKSDQIREQAVALYKGVIVPLGATVINPAFAGDSLMNRDRRYKRQLRRFNRAFVLIQELDEQFIREMGLYDKYWNMASIGCTPRLYGCRAKNFVGSTHKSTYILQKFAWDLNRQINALIKGPDFESRRNKLIVQKFMVMRYAFMVSGGGKDANHMLAMLYLISNEEWDSLPEEMRPQVDVDQHRSIVGRITKNLGDRLKDETIRTKLIDYVSKTFIWYNYTLLDQKEQVRAYGSIGTATGFLKMACNYYREDTNMNDAIKQSLSGYDRMGKPGFLKRLKNLKEGKHASTLRNMRLTYEFKADELLFIVDQLFRGHWDDSIAKECFDARHKGMNAEARAIDKKELMAIIENYIRVELLNRIIETNEFMSEVFSPREGERKLSSKEIFWRAISESRRLKSGWDRLLSRIDQVKRFVKGNLEEIDRKRQIPEYKQLRNVLGQVKNNIKILVVYPNMLVMSYYMAARNFSVDIPAWWGGSYKLNSEIIINWLFGGVKAENAARPWFNFGNDYNAIKKFENFYSFFYALKANTFATFAEGDAKAISSSERTEEQKIISEVNFFGEVVRRYVNKLQVSLNKIVEKLEIALNNNDGLDRLEEVCDAELAVRGKDSDFEASAEPVEYTISTTVEGIQEGTFFSKKMQAALRNSYGSGVEGNLKTARTKLYIKVLFVKTMVGILKDHWETQIEEMGDLSPHPGAEIIIRTHAEKEKELLKIEGNFKMLNDVIRRFQQYAMRRHVKLGECLYVAEKIEFDQNYMLYDMEVDRLRVVHDAYQILKEQIEEGPDADELLLMPTDEPSKGNYLDARFKSLNEAFTAAVNGVYAPDASSYFSESVHTVLRLLAQRSRVYFSESVHTVLRLLAQRSRVYFNYLLPSSSAPNFVLSDTKGFDSLTYTGGYKYARWNMLLRMRHNIMDINPRISVDPILEGTVRDNHSLFTSAQDDKFITGGDPRLPVEKFVGTVMAGMNSKGFVKWWDSRHMLSAFTNRMNLMMEIYKNQKHGIFSMANSGCELFPKERVNRRAEALAAERDGGMNGSTADLTQPEEGSCEFPIAMESEISMKDIIEEHFRITRLVNITERDAKYLRLLQRPTKYSWASIQSMYLDTRKEPHSIFEIPYAKFSEDRVMMTQAIKAAVTFNAMISDDEKPNLSGEENNASADQEKISDELIFLANHDTVRSNTKSHYRPGVKATMDTIREMEDYVFCYERKDKDGSAEDSSILYKLRLEDPEMMSGWSIDPKEKDGDVPIYLEYRLSDDHNDNVIEFYRSTKNFYLDKSTWLQLEKLRDAELEERPDEYCQKILNEGA